ncbi:hypothetical protein SAMN05216388_102516 [Halorientalis persicus]|uniref:Uncharacterized protein n=1 Tax=Halorientalis persicus TaxID=1367881 RepID=A0A1H8U169_9EURY|nr:hypothetical protein [Halorientalis persicus]SEO97010.1 hypothetical protein SAMN05216388_102516 [Halorientalis persicus]
MFKINREIVSRTLPNRKALSLCGLVALIALAGCGGMLGGEQGTATPTPTDENATDNRSAPSEKEPFHKQNKSFQYIQQSSEQGPTLTYNWTIINATVDKATVFTSTPDQATSITVNQSAVGEETAVKFGSVYSTLNIGPALVDGHSLENGNSWTTDESVTVTIGENQTVKGVTCTEVTADRPDAEVPSTWCVNPSETYPFALSYERGSYEIRLENLVLP